MLEAHATTCPMDCPDACSLTATVENDRLVALGPGPGNPDTAGFICTKVSHFGRHFEHPERLIHPLRRIGSKGRGEFEAISWDAALDEITRRFRAIAERHGAEAILPYHYGGSNGRVTDGLVDLAYFRRLGASRLARTVCAAPTYVAQMGLYGKMAGVAYGDYPEARAIVIWGANPKVSHIHLVPHLKEARRRGAFLAVVDPLKNFSDREVDLHLAPRPGTDLVLALALIHRWHEEGRIDHEFLARWARGGAASAEPLLEAAAAWPLARAAAVADVPAGDLARLADAYAEASPALLRVGWGPERNRNGTRATAALLAIPALLGKFGCVGGGYTLSNSGVAKLDLDDVFGPTFEAGATTRELNMNQLGALLEAGPAALGYPGPDVHGLFVYNCNPVATVPDQNAILRGLAREELFTVVFEQVATDTVPWADIVLPATTFLEHRDLRVGYGSYTAGGMQPVLSRRGEARPNVEVFAELGRRMGFTEPIFTWNEDTATREVAERFRIAGNPLDAEHVINGGHQAYDFPGPRPVQFVTALPLTPDGLIDLVPAALGAEPYEFLPPDPGLALVSPGSGRWISSSFGQLGPELTLTLHPVDAAARGLASGATVRVWNELGEVVCRLEVSSRTRPGVAVMPKGAWRRSTKNGATATALAASELEPVAGGACFNDARVEVAAA